MRVSIIIPNWNGEEKLKRNLPKVLRVKEVDEVIVVDDFSTDGSVKLLKENFPEVKRITQKRNYGFSTTVNTGVRMAKGELVFLLNTDAVPDEDCLQYALSYFKDQKVFSVGCNTGGSWSWAKFEKGYFWHYMADKTGESHQTLWASGGSGIFRKKIWEELGGFDELFNRFYEEDTDLGYRATKRGYINIWESKCQVEHYKVLGVIKENFSNEFVSKIAQRNQLYFIWKNIHDKRMIRDHIFALSKRLITHPKYLRIFLSAFIHLPAILSERSVEKTHSKLTDKEILG